jgi:two-component system NarL family response regulator
MCVDDHRVVREGIAAMINRHADMHVVASAATGEESVELFKRHHPDVTLMDLQLPGMNGVDAIRQIRRVCSEARVIVLTVFQGDEDIYRSLEAGAATYLLKDSLSDELVRMIRDVHAGKQSIPPNIQALLAERGGYLPLTSREVDVLGLLAKGFSNKEIAGRLNITEDTAKVHMRNIFGKLNVSDRTAAVTVALRRGIIHL